MDFLVLVSLKVGGAKYPRRVWGCLGPPQIVGQLFLGFCLDWTTIDYMKHENSVQSIEAVPIFRLFVVVAKCLP